MKKHLFLKIGLVVLAAVSFSSIALAVSMNDEVVIIEKGTVIDDDLFVGGEKIVISGRVNGDVFAAGGTIEIDGEISGDLYAVGGALIIKGTIGQDLVAAGGQLSLLGAHIGDSVVSAAGQTMIDSSTEIGGALVSAGGVMDMRGKVARGMTGAAGEIALSGSVGKEARLGVGRFRVEKTASIGGNLVYYSQREAEIDPLVKIGGVVERRIVPRPEKDFMKGAFYAARAGFLIWSFLAALLIGFIFLAVFRKIGRYVALASKSPGMNFLIGFLVLILTPFAIVLLMMTVIGIPLGLLLAAGYAIALYFAKIMTALVLGDYFGRVFKKTNRYLLFAAGLLAYYVVMMLPFVGPLAALAALLFGLGATVVMKKEFLKKLR